MNRFHTIFHANFENFLCGFRLAAKQQHDNTLRDLQSHHRHHFYCIDMNTLSITGTRNKTPRYKQGGILRSPPPRRAIPKHQQHPMTMPTRALVDSQAVLPTHTYNKTCIHKSVLVKDAQKKLSELTRCNLLLKAFLPRLSFHRLVLVVFVSHWTRPSA